MADNNYILNGSSLASIADAIRSKSGSSQKLTFPDEFVSAINNISTGMEPTFTVVGGTNQPSSPTENTIWINTSTAITSWVFASSLPTSPIEGMVLIVTGSDSNVSFDAITNNALYVYPITAWQYINQQWVQKTMKVYQSGQWKENIATLYDAGNTYSALTGGWTTTGYYYGDASENTGLTMATNQIQLKTRSGSSSNTNTVIGTVNPIVVSGKKVLKVTGSITSYNSNVVYMVGLRSSKGDVASSYVAATRIYSGGTFEATVDVSTINGSYYVFLCAATLPSSSTYDSYMIVTKVSIE